MNYANFCYQIKQKSTLLIKIQHYKRKYAYASAEINAPTDWTDWTDRQHQRQAKWSAADEGTLKSESKAGGLETAGDWIYDVCSSTIDEIELGYHLAQTVRCVNSYNLRCGAIIYFSHNSFLFNS